ncbi:hypothetical protein A0H81_11574 [Grifola frondosa]|uniref:RNA ligase domain-containing protein n=1 Tax=Grifola frondosa TaxID=5627 RepID=A0A1C7LWG9_GRIFR|nr:hypothetical protein A0H81_11574 [Grifola frondosa]
MGRSLMQRAFVRPSLAEGFEAVAIIRSFAAVEQLVARLSPPISLLKFPRTAHILNLGSASSDDIVSSMPLFPDGTNVVITEKVDGANMGFSLSADRSQILVQNRSHYINPTSHEQFKKLGLWLDRRRDDLHRVLDRDPYFPQHYILYEEWLAATHSMEHTWHPDWFMAFDLYDRSSGQWMDRTTLETLLLDTGIHIGACLA